MRWSDKYATGVERIDEDHKMIFKMVEDYGHFGFEEHCMSKFRCPAAEKNQEAHKEFLETLSKFRERYAAIGYDYAEARRLVGTVDQWLDNHICHIDVHLKRCVTK